MRPTRQKSQLLALDRKSAGQSAGSIYNGSARLGESPGNRPPSSSSGCGFRHRRHFPSDSSPR
jgi:hypothetical protein